MKEKMLLVKFDSSYADEFDVEGFTVMSESEWQEHKAQAKKCFENFEKLPKDQYGRRRNKYGNRVDGIEVYFGTNEQMIYETLGCYLSSFSISEISDEDIAVLNKFFSYGDQIRFGKLCMIEAEEEEEVNED